MRLSLSFNQTRCLCAAMCLLLPWAVDQIPTLARSGALGVRSTSGGLPVYQKVFRSLQRVRSFRASEVSVSYRERSYSIKCARYAQSVRYQAPDRIDLVAHACNPAGALETQETVQVGGKACHRTSWVARGRWFRADRELFLDGNNRPNVAAATLVSMLAVAPAHIGEGSTRLSDNAVVKEAFGAAYERDTTSWRGRRMVRVLPVWAYYYQRQVGNIQPVGVKYHGREYVIRRTVERGELAFDPRTARPLEYASRTVADIGVGPGILDATESVKFDYDSRILIRVTGNGARTC